MFMIVLIHTKTVRRISAHRSDLFCCFFLLTLYCTECNALNNILGKEEVNNNDRDD